MSHGKPHSHALHNSLVHEEVSLTPAPGKKGWEVSCTTENDCQLHVCPAVRVSQTSMHLHLSEPAVLELEHVFWKDIQAQMQGTTILLSHFCERH